MIKSIFLGLACFSLISCSTMTRQKWLSAAGGALIVGTIGAYAGQKLSPNEESESSNELMGMVIGSAIGAYAGSKTGEYFWKRNPENKDLNNMILEDISKSSSKSVRPPIQKKLKKRISLDAPIPEELRGKIDAPKINYDVFEVIETSELDNNGRKVIYESHNAIEYKLD